MSTDHVVPDHSPRANHCDDCRSWYGYCEQTTTTIVIPDEDAREYDAEEIALMDRYAAENEGER